MADITPRIGDRYHIHSTPSSKEKVHVQVKNIKLETQTIVFFTETRESRPIEMQFKEFTQRVRNKTITPASCRRHYPAGPIAPQW